jgi:hypothetical protein
MKALSAQPALKEKSMTTLTRKTLTFAYVPGKGTTLRVGDKDLDAFEGKGFADAVFSIWLGQNHHPRI